MWLPANFLPTSMHRKRYVRRIRVQLGALNDCGSHCSSLSVMVGYRVSV